MICPDCKGKKKIELALSTVDCDLCKGQGSIPDAEPEQVFDPDALPPIVVSADPNSDFCFEHKPGPTLLAENVPAKVIDEIDRRRQEKLDKFAALYGSAEALKRLGRAAERAGAGLYNAFNNYADDGLTGCSFLQVSNKDGHLYQVNAKTDARRYLGAELICMVDGFSRREKWADLSFYPPGLLCRKTVVRLDADTVQREMCLFVVEMGNTQHYRFRPFLLGDQWEITVEGLRQEKRVHRAKLSDFSKPDLGTHWEKHP